MTEKIRPEGTASSSWREIGWAVLVNLPTIIRTGHLGTFLGLGWLLVVQHWRRHGLTVKAVPGGGYEISIGRPWCYLLVAFVALGLIGWLWRLGGMLAGAAG